MNGENNQIPIQEILKIFWRDRLLFLLMVFIFAASSVIISLLIPNQYTASGTYQINEDESASSLSSIANQFGGLASLGGLSLPDSADKSDFAVLYLKSKDLLEHLLTFNGNREKLFAAKSFDHEKNKIIYDKKLYNEQKNKWVRKTKLNQKLVPSHIEVHKEIIEKKLRVKKDRQTGFITIEFTHYSPVFAKNFIDLMVRELNYISRKKDLEKSQYAQDYLNKKLLKVQEVDLRQSIAKMIEVQLNKEMIAYVYDQYVLVSIDSPVIPEKKSWPQRSLIVILATFLGILVSIVVVLMRHYYCKN